MCNINNEHDSQIFHNPNFCFHFFISTVSTVLFYHFKCNFFFHFLSNVLFKMRSDLVWFQFCNKLSKFS